MIPGLHGKRVLITTGTAGIGRAIADAFVAEAAHAMRNHAIKKLVEPEQIAALACFLASDPASTISGQIFPIESDSQSTV